MRRHPSRPTRALSAPLAADAAATVRDGAVAGFASPSSPGMGPLDRWLVPSRGRG